MPESEHVKDRVEGGSPKASFGNLKCEEHSPKTSLDVVEFDDKSVSDSGKVRCMVLLIKL